MQQGDKLYDLSVGKYDVTVSSGPSFSTQREETRETLIEIMRQVPDAGPYLGDILLDHMDFVGADKVSKRLSKLLPPEIQDSEREEFTESDNPEALALQQQFQQFKQEVDQKEQQFTQEFQKIQKENEDLKTDKQIEMQKIQFASDAKQAELQIKQGELQIKQGELQIKKAESTSKESSSREEQWAYDRSVESDKQTFEADQNERDRQVDLAKTIINKKDDSTIDKNNSDDDKEDGLINTAMVDALKILSGPKRVVRDVNGSIIGVEPVNGLYDGG